MAVTKLVSGSVSWRKREINVEAMYDTRVVIAYRIGMMMTSRSFFKESDDANLVKIRAGVKRSTFNREIILVASLLRSPDVAAQKPDRQTITTSRTA